jgi:2-aminoadipate transaminase
MQSSAMRDLMALTERPDVISLAGGLPDTSLFPASELAAHLSTVAAEHSAKALQYAPTEGLAAVKQAIRDVLRAEGDDADPADMLVTTGGQQVIDLVCKVLVDPGDVIVAEAPTYPGAVPAFAAYQADVVQVAMDADGLRTDALEETLDRLDAEGRSPKFVYTIPNFQNPAGVTLSLPRRRRLVELARERELLVLEDNPYGLLRYEGEPLPTLRSLDGGEFVISLGTFSKILSPGLRLGWAVAPRPVLAKMNIGKAAADLNSSALTQLFVATFFRDGDWRGYLDKQCRLYRGRRDVMLSALGEHLPTEATWTRPEGGLFVWVTLPEGLDTTDLLAKALGRNVAFVPGRAAYLDGRGGSSLRLNFSGVGDDEIREGVRRIGDVVVEQLDLLAELTDPGARAPRRDLAAGASASDAPLPGSPPPAAALADVLELPRRGAGASADAAARRRS